MWLAAEAGVGKDLQANEILTDLLRLAAETAIGKDMQAKYILTDLLPYRIAVAGCRSSNW